MARKIRYSKDSALEPFEALTDEDLRPLSEMLRKNKEFALRSFKISQQTPESSLKEAFAERWSASYWRRGEPVREHYEKSKRAKLQFFFEELLSIVLERSCTQIELDRLKVAAKLSETMDETTENHPLVKFWSDLRKIHSDNGSNETVKKNFTLFFDCVKQSVLNVAHNSNPNKTVFDDCDPRAGEQLADLMRNRSMMKPDT